jgi:uncharacterized protein YggE
MSKKIFVFAGMLLAAALLVVSAGAALTPARAQSDGTASPPPRTLNVNGNGKAFLNPDIVYVSVGVHTEGTNAAEVVDDNTTNSQKVADALKTFNIDPKDIQTTNFSIVPQQQFDNNGKPTGTVNYLVDNTVYVTLRDITKLGDVLSAVVDAGANSINGIQFDAADRSKALSEARAAAVADARAQAEELADAAGISLVEIQTISSYGASVPMPVYEAKGLAVGGAVPVSSGQMVISVDVNIVYNIK